MRVALLGSYPSWAYREALQLRRDTRHVTTTWNVNLAEALARRPGIEVHLVTLLAGIPRDRTLRPHPELAIHFLAMERWVKGLDLLTGFRWSRRRIAGVLRAVAPDVVHGVGTEHPFAAVATSLPYPSIVTVHGVMSRVVAATSPPLWSPTRVVARIERRVMRQARHVIVISPYVREALALHETAKTYDIENPIDRAFFSDALPVAARSGLVFVGMVQPRKGLDVLFKALERLPAARRPRPIRIVGAPVPAAGRYVTELHAWLAAHGLRTAVEWIGGVDKEAVRRYLGEAAALVLPSREETAPMVIAEALACGTPVVATDVGGVRFMVEDGTTGFVVPSDDPAALAQAVDRITTLGEDGVRRARAAAERRFHPDRVAEATERAYRKVIADGE